MTSAWKVSCKTFSPPPQRRFSEVETVAMGKSNKSKKKGDTKEGIQKMPKQGKNAKRAFYNKKKATKKALEEKQKNERRKALEKKLDEDLRPGWGPGRRFN